MFIIEIYIKGENFTTKWENELDQTIEREERERETEEGLFHFISGKRFDFVKMRKARHRREKEHGVCT